MRLFVYVLSLCILTFGCRTIPFSTPIGLDDERAAKIGTVIRQTMRREEIPGLSIAVIDNGELAWAQGFGWRDKQKRLPVDTDTQFQAASISKPLTALAILHLAASGRLDLDADVNTYLKRWRLESPYNQPVTLRQLLCHRGGTGPHGFKGFSELKDAPSLVDVMSKYYFDNGPVKVVGEPGIEFRYSGGGYCIVQLAMEDVTGRPFDALMAETLLEPLHMTRSHFHQPPLESETINCARGYGRTRRLSPEGRWNVFPQKSAAGLWTTPSDLGKWIIAVQKAAAGDKNGPIPPETAREFLKEQFEDARGSARKIGMGIFLDGKDEERGFFHAGENMGYFARFGAGISSGRGWVIMTNAQKDRFDPILKAVANGFGWK